MSRARRPVRSAASSVVPLPPVKHDGTTAGHVLDCVRHQGDWLDGGMRLELLLPAGLEAVHAGVLPHVGSVAPKPPQLDVVDVLAIADLEHRDKLVLGAIKTSLAAVGVGPDAEVLQLGVDRLPDGQELTEVAPVHAHVMERAVARHGGGVAEYLLQEGDKLWLGHLAASHGKLRMSALTV